MGNRNQQSATYHVRPYRPSDRDEFLSLYETVWGRRKTVDWFEWRFETNPYREGVHMSVVEFDGELVGAEPLVPYRLWIDGETHDAFQPVDWIVHPDHRRRGVFSRMTEDVLDRYLSEVSLFFNFPNEQLLPGLRTFGWETVGPVGCRYRIQNVQQFIEEQKADRLPILATMFARLGGPVVQTGLELLDRLNTPPDDVTVDRTTGVPVETVHELYRSNRPERTHIIRDRSFLNWRFANPNWETTSYVAIRDGTPVASLVAATERTATTRITHVLDTQPMDDRRCRPEVFEALVSAAVSEAGESDLIRAPGSCYSNVFRRYGFLRDDMLPLSLASTQTTQAVRTNKTGTASASEETTSRGHDRITDPDNWQLTVADIDIE